MRLVPELRWRAQCSLDCPSSPEARPQGRVWHPHDFRPLGNAPRLALKGQGAILPAVPCLLRRGGPSHVARSVALIVIDAVKRMAGRWPASNISQECIKTFGPALADGNPSASVIRIGAIRRVQTALLYPGPYDVFRTVARCGDGSFCSAAAGDRTVFTPAAGKITEGLFTDCSARSTGNQRALAWKTRGGGRIVLHRAPPVLGVIPPAAATARGLLHCTAHDMRGFRAA